MGSQKSTRGLCVAASPPQSTLQLHACFVSLVSIDIKVTDLSMFQAPKECEGQRATAAAAGSIVVVVIVGSVLVVVVVVECGVRARGRVKRNKKYGVSVYKIQELFRGDENYFHWLRYDSITVDGNLNWQNQLNQKNKSFLDVPDGIVLNYSLKEDYPKHQLLLLRKFVVYVAVLGDVKTRLSLCYNHCQRRSHEVGNSHRYRSWNNLFWCWSLQKWSC